MAKVFFSKNSKRFGKELSNRLVKKSRTASR